MLVAVTVMSLPETVAGTSADIRQLTRTRIVSAGAASTDK
jgi:hypothetical protein